MHHHQQTSLLSHHQEALGALSLHHTPGWTCETAKNNLQLLCQSVIFFKQNYQINAKYFYFLF